MTRPRDHLLITGANGYVGARLLSMALADGYDVTALSRTRPIAASRWFRWSLTDPVPTEAFGSGTTPITAILHIAHQWESDRPEDEDENLAGSRALLAAARVAGIKRFVLASSVSARDGALNRYGRVKWRLTQELNGPEELAARIGMVYGGPRLGQWGAMCALAGKLPVLPMVGANKGVQPIHVDDVCRGLLRMALIPHPDRPVYGLAAPCPIPFGHWLKLLARHIHGSSLVILSLPLSLVLLAVRIVNRLPLPIRVAEERVMGLVGLPIIETAADLTALGLAPRPLEPALASEFGRRRRLEEARAALACVSGARPRPSQIAAYCRGIERHANGTTLPMPRLAHRYPPLLRLFEPPFGSLDLGNWRGRLHMALTIAECSLGDTVFPTTPVSRFRVGLCLLSTIITECLSLPVRMILGRRPK